MMVRVLVLLFLGITAADFRAHADDAEYIDHALAAEKFIASQRVDTPDGILWKSSPETPEAPNDSFYSGSGGIALYYVELHRQTGEQRFLDIAIEAGNLIRDGALKRETDRISFYRGWTANVFVLNELYRATQDESYRAAAKHCIAKIKSQAEEVGSGVGWIEQNPFAAYSPDNVNIGEVYDLTIGAAGVGVMFLYADRQGLDDDAITWARKIADRLIEVAENTDDGLRWPMMANGRSGYIMPNFSHGPAGIAYFLADLYTVTKDTRYLDAALSATAYVKSRSVKKGDGFLVTHHESPEPADLYYLGTCHGPAGTGRLMYLLHEITGDAEWMEWIEGNLRGMEAIGAPEERSPGLWNNYSQCCGDAGLGEYALYLYSATGKEYYRELARRVARGILSSATKAEGQLSWKQSEMRIKPEFQQTQTGYMQGAAGMGSFFLHLATVDGESPKIDLLATPFE